MLSSAARYRTCHQGSQSRPCSYFRLDKTANIHVVIGKASFDAKKLYESFAALMNAINKAWSSKPEPKGLYIKRVVVNASMENSGN